MWSCSYSRGPYAYRCSGCATIKCVFPELFMKRMVALKAKREHLGAEIKAHFEPR